MLSGHLEKTAVTDIQLEPHAEDLAALQRTLSPLELYRKFLAGGRARATVGDGGNDRRR